jgi:limonene-1,2-epoxide hydrolase
VSLPPQRGPVGRALQTWLDSPSTTTAHALATTTARLDPACDVLTDDDVQGSLRRLYDLAEAAPGAIESVTGLRELPPLVRARSALESAVEFELRVRTAHHVAVACERHEPLGRALLHLVGSMHGPALAGYLERHAPRHQVEHHRTLSIVHPGDRAAAPGHALVTDNVATMFRLHPRLRPCAAGFEAARTVTTTRTRPRLDAAARRVGLVPLPVSPVTALDSDDEVATVDTVLGQVGVDAPDVGADVLLGAASYLYLVALHESRLLADWRSEERPDDSVSV